MQLKTGLASSFLLFIRIIPQINLQGCLTGTSTSEIEFFNCFVVSTQQQEQKPNALQKEALSCEVWSWVKITISVSVVCQHQCIKK